MVEREGRGEGSGGRGGGEGGRGEDSLYEVLSDGDIRNILTQLTAHSL